MTILLTLEEVGLTPVSKTLTPSYDVRQLATKTVSPSYNVTQLASDTLTPTYNVTQRATKTLTPTYNVLQLATKTLTPTYSLAQLTTKTLTPTYQITNGGYSKTLTPTYDVRQLATKTIVPTYNVTQLVSDTLTPTYTVYQLATKTLTPTYSMTQLATKTLAPTYNLLQLATKTLSPVYDIESTATQVSKTLTPTYNVAELATKTLSPSYNMMRLTSKHIGTYRKNYIYNPTCDVATSGFPNNWVDSGNKVGTPTRTILSDQSPPVGTKCLRYQYTGVAGDSGSGVDIFLNGGNIAQVIAGETWTGSFYVKGSCTGVGATIGVHGYTEGMGWLENNAEAITLTSEWQRVSVTKTWSASGVNNCCLVLSLWAFQEGDVCDIYVTGGLLEKEATAQTFFSGDSAMSSWSGTQYASTSIEAKGIQYDILNLAPQKTLTPTYSIAQLATKAVSPTYDIRQLGTKTLSPTYTINKLVRQNTGTVRTNLATNSGFNDGDSSGFPDLWGETHWETNNTPAFSVVSGYSGRSALRVQYTPHASDTDGAMTFYQDLNTAVGYFEPGDKLRFSMWVKGQVQHLTTQIRWENSAHSPSYTWGNLTGNAYFSDWTRLSAEHTCPSGCNHINQVDFYMEHIDSADPVIDAYLSCVLIEKSTSLGGYFDGDSSQSVWNGSQYVSTSTEYKGITYDILNTAPQKTITPTYDMMQLATKTITPVYDILTSLVAVSKTLTPSYNILMLVQRTLNTYYDVLQLIAQTLTPTYGVLNLVEQKTLTPTYNMRSLGTKSLSPTYNIICHSGNSISPTYDVRQLTTKTVIPTYNINCLRNKTVTPTYNISALANKPLTPVYNIRSLAQKTITPTYRIREPWSVRGLTKAYGTMDVKYNESPKAQDGVLDNKYTGTPRAEQGGAKICQ